MITPYSEILHREVLNISKELKADPEKFWHLNDPYFFGAGACHVLAYEFKILHPDYNIYLIKPFHSRGTHVFVSNLKFCFDYQGYSLYEDYLNNYKNTCKTLFGNWDCEVIKIEEDFETFCEKYYHRKMNQFSNNPQERTVNFIRKFNNN